MEADLFYSGVRPAINVGLSVSRVGGAAQTKATKQVAGQLRLDLAQYREMAAFAQFGSDLDTATQSQLARGERLVEILKQDQYKPYSMAEQVIAIFAGVRGLMDDVDIKNCKKFELGLIKFIQEKYSKIIESIESNKKIDDTTEKDLTDAVGEYKGLFRA